jgi:HK97 family phage major capsid protein
MDILRKAILNISDNSGINLIPEVIDPYIQELARTLSPFQREVPRQEWLNDTYTVVQRTANIVGKALGENDQWTTNRSALNKKTFEMKTIGSQGGVSNKLQEGSQLFFNALNGEIESAVRGAVKFEEHCLLNGDSGVDTNQFDGLKKQIVTNTGWAGHIGFDMLDDMDDTVKARGFGMDLTLPQTSGRG